MISLGTATVKVSLVETAAVEATTLGANYTEIINTEVVTTLTSVPPGNDHNRSFSYQFS